MSNSINPYASPASPILPPLRDQTSTTAILSKAWEIFSKRFVVIAFTVMVIWIPCELLSSYMDSFVFGEDDFKKSFKFSQFLDNFFGIIATAGVIHVALHHGVGNSTSVVDALSEGFRTWPRMWWARFLSNLVLVLSLLLLVVPCIYLFPRLLLMESVVVIEGLSGSAAMKRSYELTRGRYWQLVGLLLSLAIILCVPIGLFVILSVWEMIPDHWILDTFVSVLLDVISAYCTVSFFCLYDAFSHQIKSE